MDNKGLKIALVANWGIGNKIFEWLISQTEFQFNEIVVFTRKPNKETQNDAFEFLLWNNTKKMMLKNKKIHLFPLLTPDALTLQLESFMPDWVLMHSYPYILKTKHLSVLPNRFLNLHPSLLPKYRGADPATWVLQNKEKTTGISVTIVEKGIDSGPIYHQEILHIDPLWNRSKLLDNMQLIIAPLLFETFTKLSQHFVPIIQNSKLATMAPKIKKTT
jgi:methionyl-tRNA formyltransferase